MGSSPRYYLHGDEAEDLPGSYYCKKCDVFFTVEHFQKPCGDETHFTIFHRHLDNINAAKKHIAINRPLQPKSISHVF